VRAAVINGLGASPELADRADPSCDVVYDVFSDGLGPSRDGVLAERGYTDFAVAKDVDREHYLRLVDHAAANEIVFDFESYPLDRVAEAWARQADGGAAKIVVTLP
jgi:hypothetical protein